MVTSAFLDALLARCYTAWLSGVFSEARRKELAARSAMAKMSGRADMLAKSIFEAYAEGGGLEAMLEAPTRRAPAARSTLADAAQL